jgi:hypothetical protein
MTHHLFLFSLKVATDQPVGCNNFFPNLESPNGRLLLVGVFFFEDVRALVFVWGQEGPNEHHYSNYA